MMQTNSIQELVMSKPKSILKIEPENELRFQGPFNNPVSVDMKLSNNVDKKVCFKVKTTAPNLYRATPAKGVIGPNEAVTLRITLLPSYPNVSNKKRGKQKFQILSAVAPEGEFSIETVWKESSLIIDIWKLKCVLESGTDSDAEPLAANGLQESTSYRYVFCIMIALLLGIILAKLLF